MKPTAGSRVVSGYAASSFYRKATVGSDQWRTVKRCAWEEPNFAAQLSRGSVAITEELPSLPIHDGLSKPQPNVEMMAATEHTPDHAHNVNVFNIIVHHALTYFFYQFQSCK